MFRFQIPQTIMTFSTILSNALVDWLIDWLDSLPEIWFSTNWIQHHRAALYCSVLRCIHTSDVDKQFRVLLLPRFHLSQSRDSFLLWPRFQQIQFVDKYRMCLLYNHCPNPTLKSCVTPCKRTLYTMVKDVTVVNSIQNQVWTTSWLNKPVE